jgi:hypothetical protein
MIKKITVMILSFFVLLYACKKNGENSTTNRPLGNITGHWDLDSSWAINYENNIFGDTLYLSPFYAIQGSFLDFTDAGTFHFQIKYQLNFPNDTVRAPNSDLVGNYSLLDDTTVNLNYNRDGENLNLPLNILSLTSNKLKLLGKGYGDNNILNLKVFYDFTK